LEIKTRGRSFKKLTMRRKKTKGSMCNRKERVANDIRRE